MINNKKRKEGKDGGKKEKEDKYSLYLYQVHDQVHTKAPPVRASHLLSLRSSVSTVQCGPIYFWLGSSIQDPSLCFPSPQWVLNGTFHLQHSVS